MQKCQSKKAIFIILYDRPDRHKHTHTQRQRHVYNGMLSQLPLLCRLTFQHSIACYVLVWNAIRFCECEKGNKIYQFPYFFFSCLRVKCLPRTRYVACTYKDTVCFYGQRINLIHKQTQKRPLYSRKLFERRKKSSNE